MDVGHESQYLGGVKNRYLLWVARCYPKGLTWSNRKGSTEFWVLEANAPVWNGTLSFDVAHTTFTFAVCQFPNGFKKGRLKTEAQDNFPFENRGLRRDMKMLRNKLKMLRIGFFPQYLSAVCEYWNLALTFFPHVLVDIEKNVTSFNLRWQGRVWLHLWTTP